MKKMPVIMYFRDRFQNPPFKPNMAVNIDDVMDQKYEMYDCHVSQVYEWLPFTHGDLEDVPADPKERLEWLRTPRVPRDRVLAPEELTGIKKVGHHEYYEASFASKFRDCVVERYGESGKRIIFAEVFESSAYGQPLTAQNRDILFPF